MHRAALQAAATMLIATTLHVVPQNASADVGKLRALTPAERAERLERLRPNYRMPWLLPTIGPESVTETAEAFNTALWTLATPEWTPDLVMLADISKSDFRINPKKNPIACRPEGGSAEIHFDHKKVEGTNTLVLMRLEDLSCDAATRTGLSHAVMYFSDGTIRLGRAQISPTTVTVAEWRAFGDFGGKYSSTSYPDAPTVRPEPVVSLYHSADQVQVGVTDPLGNVYFREDGGRILERRKIPFRGGYETVGSAPDAAYVHVLGVGLVNGWLSYEGGFQMRGGLDQLEDAQGRWRMWAYLNDFHSFIDSTAGAPIAPPISWGRSTTERKTLTFWQYEKERGKRVLVETADTTELGPPGIYAFEGEASLAKGTAELRDILDLAGGRVSKPTESHIAFVRKAVLENVSKDMDRLDANRRARVQEIEKENAQLAAQRRAAEARSREARMQAFAEMNRLVNNMRDERMYEDLRRQQIALGRQSRQSDQFGFNPPPPPPPPSYQEWRAQTEARRNAWRMPALRVRTTVPVGGASAQTTPTPSRSGASLPPRTTPPPKVPIIRGSARPM